MTSLLGRNKVGVGGSHQPVVDIRLYPSTKGTRSLCRLRCKIQQNHILASLVKSFDSHVFAKFSTLTKKHK